MAVTVNVTVNNEVEGIRISEQLADMLFGHLTDHDKAVAINQRLQDILSQNVAFDQNQPLAQAAAWVQSQVTEIG